MADRCPVCGAGALVRRYGVRDHETGESFELDACRSCGTAFTEPVPRSMDRYYGTRYRRFRPLAAAVLRRLYRARLSGWRRRLPPAGRALDVGAGTGYVLQALRDLNWAAVGTERSLEAAAVARSASRAPVFVGGLDAVRESADLDLVVMFHVLEHLPDPMATLGAVADRLRPGGVLVLGLPNGGSWQARAAGARWMHLDVPRHLVHFTARSIEIALASAGLRCTRIDFRSVEHDPLGWLQLALDRMGWEEALITRLLVGAPTRSGRITTLAAMSVAAVLFPFALALSVASWWAGAGAVMEVWAVRDGTPRGRTSSDPR